MTIDGLLSALFALSKRRWAAGLFLETAASFVGVLAVALDTGAVGPGMFAKVGLMSIVGTLGKGLRWRSELYRDRAEWLLRAKELHDGLGVDVDARFVADLKADYAGLGPLAERLEALQGRFYATTAQEPRQRQLEIIAESAWWSERLSLISAKLIYAIVAILILTALFTLPIASTWKGTSIPPDDALSLLTLTICFIFSADIARVGSDYQSFAASAGRTVDTCLTLLRVEHRESGASLVVWKVTQEYQLARSKAPPILAFVWSWKRKNLREIWETDFAKLVQKT